VYVHTNILILHLGANHKAGAAAKPENERDRSVLSQVSSLPRIGDALQKLLCILGCNRWSFNRLLLAVYDDDRRLADMQLQLIRAIGMNKVQEIIHRIHILELATNNRGERAEPAAGDFGGGGK
jgi:hypothetical protein